MTLRPLLDSFRASDLELYAILSSMKTAPMTAIFIKDTNAIPQSALAVSKVLDTEHSEYEFIDQSSFSESIINEGLLICGFSVYDTIVIPEGECPATILEFENHGGRVIRGTETWAMYPTCPMLGEGNDDIVVVKRIDGTNEVYAFVNTGKEQRRVELIGIGGKTFAPGETFTWRKGDPAIGIYDPAKTKAEPLPVPFGEAYDKLWSDDFNAEIDARIEKYRKTDFSMEGFPPGADVEIRQVKNDFLVGCNMFNFGQLGKPEWDRQYQRTWEPGGIFNAATIPFYWANFEWERGKPRYISSEADSPERWAAFRKARDYKPVCHWTKECPWEWRRPAPDRLISFCKANEVHMHGHCIIYPAWDPDWAKAIGLSSREALQELYDERIRGIASFYGDTFPQWDVVNESWNRQSGTEHPNDFVCVHNGLWGRRVPVPKDYTFKAYKLAEKVFPPSVKLCFNDAAQDGYFAFSRTLMERGAKIDISGFQMHIFSDKDVLKTAAGLPCTPNGMDWNPQHQIETFRKLDRLGKPIHLSEVTIPSPRSLLPEAEADALQARLIRDNFRLWFSWPSIYRITYWNLVDGTGAEILASGMYNADLSKKSAYYAIDKLVNHEWRTNITAKVDENGRLSFRGFKGEYELRCTTSDGKETVKTVHL